MPRIVAVTGATGFIGSHIACHLARAGWHVRILTRRLPAAPQLSDTPVEAIIGTLEDRRALARLLSGVDAVIHAAGLIKARTHAEFFAINAAGTRFLVEAAAAHADHPKFVLLSSIAARHPQISDYAASKLAAEAELTRLDGQLPWSILRPSAVYGPGDRETLAFFHAIARGIALLPPGRGNRVSLIHVADLAAAGVAVLDASSTNGRIYEVDDGRHGGYSWEDLVDIATRHLGRHPLRLRLPSILLTGAAYLNAFARRRSRHPPMFTPGKLREMLHPDWVTRDRSLLEATNWRPLHDAEIGFAETITWYRSHGWL
jgi:nucleoside-diphosphate-sugar epimerase